MSGDVSSVSLPTTAPHTTLVLSEGSIPQNGGFVKGGVTNWFTVVILTDSKRETSDIYVDSRDGAWYDKAVLRQHTKPVSAKRGRTTGANGVSMN